MESASNRAKIRIRTNLRNDSPRTRGGQRTEWTGLASSRLRPTPGAPIIVALPRLLHLLLVFMLAFVASGISSAIAATGEDQEQCCSEAEDSRDEDAPPQDDCPPLCHACACSPSFAIPRLEVVTEPVVEVLVQRSLHVASNLPLGPPSRGVFHPPRASA